ncbi:MAG: hypothetical protein IKS65_03585 [Bacteroidales bacterium]|nr:hypothetical protein [Bacteroidales bacterium]
MENNIENKEMTAQQSLGIITEMMNNSRRAILQNSAKHFILWGLLLIVVSFVIYELWHVTGNPAWNFLWFAMPAIGFPVARVLDKKDSDVPQNHLNKQIGAIWLAYCAFAMTSSVIAVFAVPMPITLVIVIALGFAECVSGIVLKNWAIIISGFVLGVGGAVAAAMLVWAEQLLIFTIGGIILVATGLIVKHQYK